MIEFSMNKTMQWLKDQAEEQKRCLIIQARKTRQHHEEQMRRDAKSLMEKKVLQRAELVEQGEKKKEKAVAIIDNLRKSPLIATVKEFERRKRILFSLSIPVSLKEDELRVLRARFNFAIKYTINRLSLTNLKAVN